MFSVYDHPSGTSGQPRTCQWSGAPADNPPNRGSPSRVSPRQIYHTYRQYDTRQAFVAVSNNKHNTYIYISHILYTYIIFLLFISYFSYYYVYFCLSLFLSVTTVTIVLDSTCLALNQAVLFRISLYSRVETQFRLISSISPSLQWDSLFGPIR